MKTKYGRLQLLQKKAFKLQKQFLEELNGADSEGLEFIKEETHLQKSFDFFLQELDEAIRVEAKGEEK